MSNKGKNVTDRISFQGDRDIWQDFMYVVKKQRLKVWDALEPTLKEYIEKNK